MTTLQDRITEIMEVTGLKVGEISRITGVSSSAVTQWKDGPTKSLKTSPATKLAEATGFNAMWIATGDGPKGAPLGKKSGPVEINLDNNPDYPSIRRVRFKLSASASGFGIDYRDDDGPPIPFPRQWYERRGLKPENLFATMVANGSMEPGLFDGDTVVVNTAQAEPKDGYVFAVNYEGELVIKRLLRDNGQWWLTSDNPDQRRYPRKVCHEGVRLLGEIVHKQSERI